MGEMLSNTEKKHLLEVIEDYNAKYPKDSPPPLNDQLDFLVSQGHYDQRDTVLLALMHFFIFYKGFDTSVEEFLDVVGAMKEMSDEQGNSCGY
jgi:hypothetical protein